jgi:hypothetical protein
MITSTTETMTLNLETIQALIKMQRLACAFAEKVQIAYHKQYAEWQEVMGKTQHFFQELEFKEKVALVTERAETLEASAYDIKNLHELMAAINHLLNSQKEIKRLNASMNNAKFYYSQLEVLADVLDRKFNQLKRESKIV